MKPAVYRSLVTRNELFLATAAVAAHATFKQEGFRQRDMKFYIELFSNWVEVSFDQFSLSMQNTQISRFLDTIVKEGFAQKLGRGKTPRYHLTRVGLLELINRCVSKDYLSRPTRFFFLYFFIGHYKTRITDLVRLEGREFPHALRIELDSLLDEQALLKRQISFTDKAIKRLKARVDDGARIVQFASQKGRSGAGISDVVKEVERLFPYELNNQKPLTELIHEIPLDQREWEICEGTKYRSAEIFEPALRLLQNFHKELTRLSA